MSRLYLEFQIHDEAAFTRLQKFFYQIKMEKEQGILDCRDAKWMDYFTEESLLRFWWPTDEEVREHSRIWQEIPADRRLTDPRLQRPWDFESLIDAFSNGEYELISCEKASPAAGRLEFFPFSWPYGGSGSFKALLEYSGFEITAESV